MVLLLYFIRIWSLARGADTNPNTHQIDPQTLEENHISRVRACTACSPPPNPPPPPLSFISPTPLLPRVIRSDLHGFWMWVIVAGGIAGLIVLCCVGWYIRNPFFCQKSPLPSENINRLRWIDGRNDSFFFRLRSNLVEEHSSVENRLDSARYCCRGCVYPTLLALCMHKISFYVGT